MHNEKQWWSRLQVTFIIIEKPVVFRLHLLRVQNCKQYKYTEY